MAVDTAHADRRTHRVGDVPCDVSHNSRGARRSQRDDRDERVDLKIAQVAGRQRGSIHRAQLIALGLSSREIDHRVACGRLHVLHRCVHAVGHAALSPLGRLTAAVLACGDESTVAGDAAAFVHGFAPEPRAPFDVVVPLTRRHRRPGLRIHRSVLLPGERVRRRELPVTSVARTLLDLAGSPRGERVERLVQETFAQRLTTRAQLGAMIAAHPRARGARMLRDSLGFAEARPGAERELLRLIRAAGLPTPEVNARVGDWTPDLLWREIGLAIELDSYAAHSSPWAHERDRRKDAAIRASGLEPVRISTQRVMHRPHAALADVAAALALRARARRAAE